jgi:hypothetical protein
MYRERRPGRPPPSRPTTIDRVSPLLKWSTVPYETMRDWLGLVVELPSIYFASRPSDQSLLDFEPQKDSPTEQDDWLHLRLIGWKMSVSDGFKSEFFTPGAVDSEAGVSATIVQIDDDPELSRDIYDAHVLFSAVQMIRFVFYVERVPFDKEGWFGQYMEMPGASMYAALNPNTRVHLRHRRARVRE